MLTYAPAKTDPKRRPPESYLHATSDYYVLKSTVSHRPWTFDCLTTAEEEFCQFNCFRFCFLFSLRLVTQTITPKKRKNVFFFKLLINILLWLVQKQSKKRCFFLSSMSSLTFFRSSLLNHLVTTSLQSLQISLNSHAFPCCAVKARLSECGSVQTIFLLLQCCTEEQE